MMYHHDSRPYAEAASDAARVAKDKLGKIIAEGKEHGSFVIEKIMREVPHDAIVRGKALRFDGDVDDRESGLPEGILAAIPEPRSSGLELPVGIAETLEATEAKRNMLSVHRHALSQICQRAGFPWKYAQALQESPVAGWGTPLLAHNLNELYSHQDKRFLARSYDGQLRGWLSDRFRRLDSRPLVEAFTASAGDIGAVCIEGYANDVRVALKAMLPMIFEPVENEVVVFGLLWENSDYGAGKHTLTHFLMRPWCTNYAISTTSISQVHLGKRLNEDIDWSEKTYRLDTEAMASAITDVVKHSLGPDQTTEMCEVIRAAHEEKIDPAKALRKYEKALTKGTLDKVSEAFRSPDVENLPPGNTKWRLSNAFSWVAKETDDMDQKLELMRCAGLAMDWAQGR